MVAVKRIRDVGGGGIHQFINSESKFRNEKGGTKRNDNVIGGYAAGHVNLNVGETAKMAI